MTYGLPTSPGGRKALADLTLTLPYNDFEAATALFDECGDDIAGLIVEPVVGNANCLPPREGFLQHLRDLCTRHGTLLIFDRSEEHTSELQSLMRISYAVFCLKKKNSRLHVVTSTTYHIR